MVQLTYTYANDSSFSSSISSRLVDDRGNIRRKELNWWGKNTNDSS